MERFGTFFEFIRGGNRIQNELRADLDVLGDRPIPEDNVMNRNPGVEDETEETPETSRLIPPLGLSSGLHLAALVVLYAFGKGYGAVPTIHVEKVEYVVQAPLHTQDAAQPEPTPKLDSTLPKNMDVLDQQQIPFPESGERNPAQTQDIEIGPSQTDDGEPGNGASGDPNQRGLVNQAFQIDTFVPKGIRAVRGLGRGTGPSERFGPRGPGSRHNRIKPLGGGPQTEDAVRKALEWLQHHQGPDGRWDASGFDTCCRGGTKCTGPGNTDYNVGVSGLAMLAFLAHGETASKPGTYQDTVRRGLSWLKGQQSADGCIGPKAPEKHLYNHAIAAMALAEAVGMGEYGYGDSAQKAVNYLLSCQNPAEKGGGWRYRNYNLPGEEKGCHGINDTSVTGWAVMALKSARMAELTVPDDAFTRADAWLDSVYEAQDYKGVFGYLRKDNGKLGLVHQEGYTTTSVGVLVKLLMGRNKGVSEGAATLLERTPDWKNPNLYYWYYATLALFQTGGESWVRWNKPMKEALCNHQERQGCQEGSWDPAQDTWGGEGGRVYTTAMGALCLEVYYRYAQGMKIHDPK